MRHFVNFSLLFFFLTLVTSGLLRFFEPFKLVTTRVHIVFGFGVLTLVALHVFARPQYFVRILKRRSPVASKPPWKMLAGVVAVWLAFLVAAFWNLPPVPQLIGGSHESRHRAVIFRPNPLTAVEQLDSGIRVKRTTPGTAQVMIEIEWGSAFEPANRFAAPFGPVGPQLAIWAETDTGTLIETFFVSEESAYAESLKWDGNQHRRVDILPVWRNRFTLTSGVDPTGEIDTYSSATPDHSFSVANYIDRDVQGFYLSVEVNAPNDSNRYFNSDQPEDADGYTLPGIGQPSVIYSAYIEPSADRRYFVLELVGHGGSSTTQDGSIHYDIKELTTAKHIVERIIARVVVE